LIDNNNDTLTAKISQPLDEQQTRAIYCCDVFPSWGQWGDPIFSMYSLSRDGL